MQSTTRLAAGNFSVSSTVAAPPGVPAVVATCQLFQGTTLIASRTRTVTETAPTEWEWTTTASETALVTDSTLLRTRYVGVTQA